MPSSGFASDIAVAALTRMGYTQGNVMLKNQNSLIVGNSIFVQHLHASAISRSFFILCCAVTNSKVIKIRDLCRDRSYANHTQNLLFMCAMIFLYSLSPSFPSPPLFGREIGMPGMWREIFLQLNAI